MSDDYDYSNESSDVAENAGRAQKHVQNVAGDIAAGRPTRTSNGKVIAPPNRGASGYSDLIVNILNFCFFIVLLGLSAACIKQIKDIKDGGNSGPGTGNLEPCFLQAHHVYRILIGILVVSAVGAVHSIVVLALSGAKRAPATRYLLSMCILPHAIILLVLGCIILGWGSPSFGVITGTTPWDLCGHANPYRLAFATGAVAVAFSGFILLFIPALLFLAIYKDIVNNPTLVQARDVLMEEGRRYGNKAENAARRGQGDEPIAEHLVRKGQREGRKGARKARSEAESAANSGNEYSE